MRNTILLLIVFLFSGAWTFADCPSADLNGDCVVNEKDFAIMANQWLTTTVPAIPDDMVHIPGGEFDMGDHHDDGYPNEKPVHTVYVDSFFMSKFEITNQQYCNYLNSAKANGDIKVVERYNKRTSRYGNVVYGTDFDINLQRPYCNTRSYSYTSQIEYFAYGGRFIASFKFKDGRYMADDPVVEVSWYGAVAYCNWRSKQECREVYYDSYTRDLRKQGYRLPTEAEWEYAARGGEHNPYYRFPWGDTISHSQANYYSSTAYPYDVSPTRCFHPDWNVADPRTAPVGSFSANGYGLYDMAGNVMEWCNDWYDPNYYNVSPYDNPLGPTGRIDYEPRIVRGGDCNDSAYFSRVANRGPINAGSGSLWSLTGFRIVLDLN